MNKKKIIKIIVLIILIVLLILVGIAIYDNMMKLKFQKILKENDSTNYELIENYNGEETTIKVRGDVLFSENNDTCVWISEEEEKRVIMSKNDKIAIITENDEELVVNSLNYTYLKDFFENSDEKFKYLGKEGNYYKIQFLNKKTGIVNSFYINIDTNMVEKTVEENNNIQVITNLSIKLNSVSEDEIGYPDLAEYDIANSVSSVIE